MVPAATEQDRVCGKGNGRNATCVLSHARSHAYTHKLPAWFSQPLDMCLLVCDYATKGMKFVCNHAHSHPLAKWPQPLLDMLACL
eukprot:1153098-Pelagomonas_calceolata.AAC.11